MALEKPQDAPETPAPGATQEDQETPGRSEPPAVTDNADQPAPSPPAPGNYELLYRHWRSAHNAALRALEGGLQSPSLVREEFLYVREQLLALRPFLGAPARTQLDACADDYTRLAKLHRAGQGRTTAGRLRILTRRIMRLLD